MKTISTIYVSGLGAIGCAYASKLFDMDPECVKVIVDRDRAERYTKNGVIINGKPYAFKYVLPDEKAQPADLILIAVKHHHLEQAIKDIRNFIGPDTIIISLLNGIVSEEIIGNEYGIEKLLYAMCVGIDAVREGTGTQFTTTGRIVFGEKKNPTCSDRVSAVKELFNRAGILSEVPEDMIRRLWWKFMMNVGINQTSAVLKASYGVYSQVKEAREFMQMASREVVPLAQKEGVDLKEEDIEEYLTILSTLSPQGKTSMLQDVEAGRKTEVEIFAGTVMELGRKYGIPTPVNEILYRMIRTLEQTYK